MTRSQQPLASDPGSRARAGRPAAGAGARCGASPTPARPRPRVLARRWTRVFRIDADIAGAVLRRQRRAAARPDAAARLLRQPDRATSSCQRAWRWHVLHLERRFVPRRRRWRGACRPASERTTARRERLGSSPSRRARRARRASTPRPSATCARACWCRATRIYLGQATVVARSPRRAAGGACARRCCGGSSAAAYWDFLLRRTSWRDGARALG